MASKHRGGRLPNLVLLGLTWEEAFANAKRGNLNKKQDDRTRVSRSLYSRNTSYSMLTATIGLKQYLLQVRAFGGSGNGSAFCGLHEVYVELSIALV